MSLERACMLCLTREDDPRDDRQLQMKSRICSSLNVRLHDFFERPTDYPDDEDALYMRKLRDDYQHIRSKFQTLCETNDIVPRSPRKFADTNPLVTPPPRNRGFDEYVTTSMTTVPNSIGDQNSKDPFQSNTLIFNSSNKNSDNVCTSLTKRNVIKAWDSSLDAALRAEQLGELVKLHNDLRELNAFQGEMGQRVLTEGECIARVESDTSDARVNSLKVTVQLAKASRTRSKWWGVGGGSCGVATGAIAGIALGPIGVAAGAAIGGILGIVTGSTLTSRHKRRMDRVIRQAQDAQRRGDDGRSCSVTSASVIQQSSSSRSTYSSSNPTAAYDSLYSASYTSTTVSSSSGAANSVLPSDVGPVLSSFWQNFR
eukprot:Lankesteria_metandrocarpae@DN2500_c0_g1_i1.p1